MIEIDYTIMPIERHYECAEHLKRDIVVFQHSRVKEMMTYPGLIPPPGKFEKIECRNGEYLLLPTAIDYAFLFRGQGQYYHDCCPSLYRTNLSELELFVEQLRWTEFELMLQQFPSVNFFQENRFRIDYLGLAQHYGLRTPVLDLTSSLDVAFFFAMCDYDPVHDRYIPKQEDKEYVGYLYAKSCLDMFVPGLTGEGESSLSVIGLQPFSRPGSQCGFSIHLKPGESFNAYLYSFSYTKDDSVAIWNQSHQGEDLWRPDEISEFTKMIKATRSFTFSALRLAVKRYGKGKSLYAIQTWLNDNDYHFNNYQPWRLPYQYYLKRKADFQQTNAGIAMMMDIVSRRSIIEGQPAKDCLDEKSFAGQIVLAAFQGGFPSIPGYKSGITFSMEEENHVFGLGTDTKREQTEPDPLTHKVNKWDYLFEMDEEERQKHMDEAIKKDAMVKDFIKPFKMKIANR